MTIDKDRLKADAEYILARKDSRDRPVGCMPVTPETVLGLLAEIERLETESREAKDAKNGLGWAINELRGSFKNFHRSLCARFGYVHDEKDWFRDQVSLQEHVAGQIDQLKAENEALRKIISDAATACGASVSVECTPEFMANLPAEISMVVGSLRKQVEDLSPFKGYVPKDFRTSNKCLACGEYHHGLGNLPCPKFTPVAQSKECGG